MREFPIEERGEINRSKLGWLLKKNANRIVDRLTFVPGLRRWSYRLARRICRYAAFTGFAGFARS